ncbi:hypothetical protein Tco_0528949 [Tanacetum coccineum]
MPSLKYNVSKPLPLGGDPGHVTIQPDFFFNKDLEYLRYGRKIGRPACLISKRKACLCNDGGRLEQYGYRIRCGFEEESQVMSSLIWDGIYLTGGFKDQTEKIVLVELISWIMSCGKGDFKSWYPSDFEDLYLLNLQSVT